MFGLKRQNARAMCEMLAAGHLYRRCAGLGRSEKIGGEAEEKRKLKRLVAVVRLFVKRLQLCAP